MGVPFEKGIQDKEAFSALSTIISDVLWLRLAKLWLVLNKDEVRNKNT